MPYCVMFNSSLSELSVAILGDMFYALLASLIIEFTAEKEENEPSYIIVLDKYNIIQFFILGP